MDYYQSLSTWMTYDVRQPSFEKVYQTLEQRYDLQIIFAQTLNNPKFSTGSFRLLKKFKSSFLLRLYILRNPTYMPLPLYWSNAYMMHQLVNDPRCACEHIKSIFNQSFTNVFEKRVIISFSIRGGQICTTTLCYLQACSLMGSMGLFSCF